MRARPSWAVLAMAWARPEFHVSVSWGLGIVVVHPAMPMHLGIVVLMCLLLAWRTVSSQALGATRVSIVHLSYTDCKAGLSWHGLKSRACCKANIIHACFNGAGSTVG